MKLSKLEWKPEEEALCNQKPLLQDLKDCQGQVWKKSTGVIMSWLSFVKLCLLLIPSLRIKSCVLTQKSASYS